MLEFTSSWFQLELGPAQSGASPCHDSHLEAMVKEDILATIDHASVHGLQGSFVSGGHADKDSSVLFPQGLLGFAVQRGGLINGVRHIDTGG